MELEGTIELIRRHFPAADGGKVLVYRPVVRLGRRRVYRPVEPGAEAQLMRIYREEVCRQAERLVDLARILDEKYENLLIVLDHCQAYDPATGTHCSFETLLRTDVGELMDLYLGLVVSGALWSQADQSALDRALDETLGRIFGHGDPWPTKDLRHIDLTEPGRLQPQDVRSGPCGLHRRRMWDKWVMLLSQLPRLCFDLVQTVFLQVDALHEGLDFLSQFHHDDLGQCFFADH